MTEENDDTIFRTLCFYKKQGQKIHIKIILGNDIGRFRNGFVINVTKTKLIFADDILGSLDYSLKEISKNIMPYKEANI